jgi:hypothetical protein
VAKEASGRKEGMVSDMKKSVAKVKRRISNLRVLMDEGPHGKVLDQEKNENAEYLRMAARIAWLESDIVGLSAGRDADQAEKERLMWELSHYRRLPVDLEVTTGATSPDLFQTMSSLVDGAKESIAQANERASTYQGSPKSKMVDLASVTADLATVQAELEIARVPFVEMTSRGDLSGEVRTLNDELENVRVGLIETLLVVDSNRGSSWSLNDLTRRSSVPNPRGSNPNQEILGQSLEYYDRISELEHEKQEYIAEVERLTEKLETIEGLVRDGTVGPRKVFRTSPSPERERVAGIDVAPVRAIYYGEGANNGDPTQPPSGIDVGVGRSNGDLTMSDVGRQSSSALIRPPLGYSQAPPQSSGYAPPTNLGYSQSPPSNIQSAPSSVGYTNPPNVSGFVQPPMGGGYSQPPPMSDYSTPPPMSEYGQIPSSIQQPPSNLGYGNPPPNVTGYSQPPPMAAGFNQPPPMNDYSTPPPMIDYVQPNGLTKRPSLYGAPMSASPLNSIDPPSMDRNSSFGGVERKSSVDASKEDIETWNPLTILPSRRSVYISL